MRLANMGKVSVCLAVLVSLLSVTGLPAGSGRAAVAWAKSPEAAPKTLRGIADAARTESPETAPKAHKEIADMARTGEGMPMVISYENLEELVTSYSPQVQMERIQYDSRLARYENAREEIMETRRLLREEADDREKNGDTEEAGQYRAQAKTLEDAAKNMDGQIRAAKGSAANMSLRRMEDTVLWTAQNLMGTYHTLRLEQAAAAAEAEWKESQYEKLLRQVQAGSAAQAEADEAGKAASAAASQAESARSEMAHVRKELLILTGYPVDSQAEIEDLPAPREERVQEMGGADDQRRALGNNYDLREQRSGSAGSNKELHARQRDIRQSEEDMYGRLDTLYEDVLASRTAWNGAATAMASQEAAFQAASNKMSLGMISRQEYLEAKAAYLEAAAGKGRADAAFQQAMDTYDWALKGLMM